MRDFVETMDQLGFRVILFDEDGPHELRPTAPEPPPMFPGLRGGVAVPRLCAGRTWYTEFGPAFDPPGVLLDAGQFDDVTYGNDVCPSFLSTNLGWTVYCDHPDPAEREFPESQRFRAHRNVWVRRDAPEDAELGGFWDVPDGDVCLDLDDPADAAYSPDYVTSDRIGRILKWIEKHPQPMPGWVYVATAEASLPMPGGGWYDLVGEEGWHAQGAYPLDWSFDRILDDLLRQLNERLNTDWQTKAGVPHRVWTMADCDAYGEGDVPGVLWQVKRVRVAA
jgi:hypothetical protein